MRRLLLFFSLFIFLISCSVQRRGGSTEELYTPTQRSILGKGIVPLSTESPYVASNLFVAEEMKRSRFFKGFIETNGVPLALELKEGDEGLILNLYYPRKRIYYIGELRRQVDEKGKEFFSEWFIRGPFVMERGQYRALRGLEHIRKAPVIFVKGEGVRFQEAARVSKLSGATQDKEVRLRKEEGTHRRASARLEVEPYIPVVKPKVVKVKKKRKKGEEVKKEEGKDLVVFYKENKEKALEAMLDPKHFRPLNTDQMALAISKGYAERNIRGDIIHTVKSPKETLQAISTWYTGDPKNTGILQKINHIKDPQALELGTKIVVPRRLIKRIKAMPEIP